MNLFRKVARSILIFCLLVWAGAANAAYPDKPITLIVPFAPGGANDAVARIVANELAKLLRQSVVIDNRPGAGGMVGTELVASARPDGYTLLLISAAHAINSSIYAKLRYDPVDSFAPISQLTNASYVLVVNKDLPATSVSELVALGKARPDALFYASSGKGSAPHLAGALFANMANIEIVHVPYKGGGPALLDLMRGDVTMYFASLSSALPHLRANKIRALGVTTSVRAPALPNTPTMSEAGVPGYELAGWYGLVAPAKTPRAIVAQLNEALAKVLENPQVRTQLLEQGEQPFGSKAEDFARFIKTEVDKYANITRSAKITPE
jgi:tripartite-type tricarboxylate transporter receptor subunit TctC